MGKSTTSKVVSQEVTEVTHGRRPISRHGLSIGTNDDDADAVAIDKKDLLFYERVGEEFYLHNLTNFRLPQNVTEASQLDVADWDGDGIHDLLFFDQAGFQVWMSRRLADGSFEPPIALLSIRVPPHTYESEVKVDFFQAIDWDGDGDLDVLLGGYSFAIYLEHAHGELVQRGEGGESEKGPFDHLFQRTRQDSEIDARG